MSVTIYHNPRCSKSRAALDLIRSTGTDPEIIEYLKEPPDRDTLLALLDMLGLAPRDLMRRNEEEYKALGLDRPELDRDELIDAMLAHPKLIERPIVVKNGKAALGRPPENVKTIL